MSGYTPPNQWDKMSNQNKLNIEREINETYRNAMMKYELNRELYIDQSDPYVTYEGLTEMYNDAVAACNAYPPNTFLRWPQPLPERIYRSGEKRNRPSGGKSMKKKKSRKPKSRRVKPKRTYI
jgi:hypothetical protein